MADDEYLRGVMKGVKESLVRIETKVDAHAVALDSLKEIKGGIRLAKWLGGVAAVGVALRESANYFLKG